MPEGALTLGQVADRIVMLDIVCNQCGRRGCLSTARLVAKPRAVDDDARAS